MSLIKDAELNKVEEAVVRAVEEGAASYYSPAELIVKLTEQGLPEDVVRVATWYLIDRREIQLTPSWKLDPVESVA